MASRLTRCCRRWAVGAGLAAALLGVPAPAADTASWDDVWNEIQQRQAAPPVIPAAALEDGPPVRDGARVLFRYRSKAGAPAVSLAGDFNRWADNQGGRITTTRFAMHPAGSGRWFRWEELPPGIHEYVFVEERPDGEFAWTKDPHVAEADQEGHSLVTIAGGPPERTASRRPPMESFLDRWSRVPVRNAARLSIGANKVWVKPGETNAIRVRFPSAGQASLLIRTPTGHVVHESRSQVAAGEGRVQVPPMTAPGGYVVHVELASHNGMNATGTTVLTVADSIAADIRYGFYAAYRSPGDDNAAAATQLADLHVNAVEFYDYFPAHGHYAPREESYIFEPFGIRISGSDVRAKIEAGHDRNMLSIAYVAAYAASRSVFDKHPFPMTDAAGAVKVFNGRVTTEAEADAKGEPKWFWLMNIASDSPWHEHILGEFARTLDDGPDDIVAFDGFEIDTYGDSAATTFHARESRRNGDLLVDVLHDFVGDVRDRARSVKPGALVSFNSVNEFGADRMGDVTDFAFLEIWRHHTPWLADLVEICHRYRGPRRQRVVLKLYPADMAPKQTAWPPGSLARILGAAMTGGGSLMVVGQPDTANGTMHGLNTLFYPDNQPLISGNGELIQAYYRHDAMWFGYTHGPDVYNTVIEAVAAGCLTRTYAAPEHHALVVQLVRQNDDGRWSTPAALPDPVHGLAVTLPRLSSAKPRQVLYASPDGEGMAQPKNVEWTALDDAIVVTVPEFRVHGTVVLVY